MTRDWMDTYNKMGALWIHNGNPRRPHALLTSGNHSDCFFDSRIVIANEDLLREAVSDLLDLYIARGGGIDGIDRVVGPQTGATKLARFISDEIAKRRKRSCLWSSPQKLDQGGQRRMVFENPSQDMILLDIVLTCDDVGTTFDSVEQTARCVQKEGGIVLPAVLVFVNRSGRVRSHNRNIVALVNGDFPIWTPDECPLCKQGSVALRPKDNWAELNGTY